MLIISMCCIYMQENALIYAPVALEPYIFLEVLKIILRNKKINSYMEIQKLIEEDWNRPIAEKLI